MGNHFNNHMEGSNNRLQTDQVQLLLKEVVVKVTFRHQIKLHTVLQAKHQPEVHNMVVPKEVQSNKKELLLKS